MGFGHAVATCFRKYVTFSGRARRPEYWWFMLFVVLCSFAASIVDAIVFGVGTDEEPGLEVFGPIVSLVTFLPLLAVGWRRMHDTGKSGWYLLLPMILSLAIVVVLALVVIGLNSAAQTGSDAVWNVAGSGVGLAVMVIGGLAELVLTVLVLWWLTRPTEPMANVFGPAPA
jgi:uncharacterized membrane protein YhaH (DUF805 family)